MKTRREVLRNIVAGALLAPLATKSHASKKISSQDSCFETTLDFYGQGPFYTDNPPIIQNDLLAALDEPGERLIISGRVFNLNCNEFIPETIVDVWHANDAGQYDNQSFNLRGITYTNAQGFYLFETIIPGKYLNGASFRPSHIHYKITPPGFPTLTTQLYFEGDEDIPGDAAASINEGPFNATHRIVPITTNEDNINEATFDIVLDGEGISVGTQDIHIDKGIIYDISPNPFINEVVINYGVFKKAKVGILVFNQQGQTLAVLEDSIKQKAKYQASWRPDGTLPNGHYYVALNVNGLQVFYKKIIKTS